MPRRPSRAQAVLELNASDDRGIDVVRNKIKLFATKKVTLPPGRHKLVILDEADAMTKGAQQALRRTMELHSATTRFALACNNSTKIIEPIQSRCAILRYARLTDVEVAKRLVEVCGAERIPRDDSGLEALVFTAEGDLRNALNSLQSTFAGFGFVSADNVYRVCDTPHPLTVGAILEACLAQDIDKGAKLMGEMWKSGYAALDVVTTVFKVLKAHARLSEPLKMELLQLLSATHMRIIDGVTTLVQMHGLCAKIAAVAKGRYAPQPPPAAAGAAAAK